MSAPVVFERTRGPAIAAHMVRRGTLPESWESAVVLIDKPSGMSSFDVIRRMRRIIGVRKIGHAGTLDPMATGLLILLVGRATKLMERFMGQDKVYTGVMRLGETTESYDAETEVVECIATDGLDDAQLDATRLPFVGDVTQRPPIYSAIKVGGERLYRKARRGETVDIPQRTVHIARFEVGPRNGDDLPFEVACTKGTYIRSLAHDYGQKLGVGAHLTALRRTDSGSLSVDEAWTLESLAEAVASREEAR